MGVCTARVLLSTALGYIGTKADSDLFAGDFASVQNRPILLPKAAFRPYFQRCGAIRLAPMRVAGRLRIARFQYLES